MQAIDDRKTYPDPQCSVDVVLLTLAGDRLQVALVKREDPDEPFYGHWALPGGFIRLDDDQDTEDTARRVLRSKAGCDAPYLEQLQTFSGRSRDPRRWSLSVAYVGVVPHHTLAHAAVADPAFPAKWFLVGELKSIPFDHMDILRAAVERLRSKAAYSSLPLYLMPECFTLTDAQAVYEVVMGGPLDARGFRRRLEDLNVIEPVGEPMVPPGKRSRPAQFYRLKPGVPSLPGVGGQKRLAYADSVIGVKGS